MCTLIVLRRPGQAWPLMLAANRDEMAGRPWKAPARHWPDRPEVMAGLDALAGGSWLGINDDGLAAGILNRVGSLGPLADKRSRGELVLEALDHAEAVEAVKALGDLDPRAYRPFNLLVADFQDAFWLRNDGQRIDAFPVPEGIHMLTAHDLDDTKSPRIATFLPRFRSAAPPRPDDGDWEGWKGLLRTKALAHDRLTPSHSSDAELNVNRPLIQIARADSRHQSKPETGFDFRRSALGNGTEEASLSIRKPDGFGTVSSALIALPQPGQDLLPHFLFAPGPPDQAEFTALPLSG